MSISFEQYIQNPMGRSNAVFSNREMYRTMYMEKLDKIMVREHGKVDYKLFIKGKTYYCYIKIPSETIEDFYYDVVIEFTEPEGKTPKTLDKYEARFYSNDPSFVFTFAHAFIENDMFITSLTDKMSKEAVKKVAVEKNPQNQVGYVKSLFFAYLIMSKRGLFNKLQYTLAFKASFLKGLITNADVKVEQRIEAGKAKEEKKKTIRQKIKQAARDAMAPEIPIKQNNIVRRTPTVGRVGKSSSIKKTGTVKRTKRI